MENVQEVIKLSPDNVSHLRNEIRDNPTLDVYDRDLYWFLSSRPEEWTSDSKNIAYQLNRTEEQVIESYTKLKLELNAIGEPF